MEKVYISYVFADGRTWAVRGNERAVTGIRPESSALSCEENAVTRNAALQLQAYFCGARKIFDFPMEWSGTDFQKQVWSALLQIPYGTTVSYGQVAAMIGRPKAVRAVGQAVRKNPCLIAVPCHRVMGKDGRLTGFSAGLELKHYLLSLEQK